MNEDKISVYYEKIIDFAIAFAPKLAGAIIILVTGFWLAKKLAALFALSLEMAKFNKESCAFPRLLCGVTNTLNAVHIVLKTLHNGRY